MPPAADASRTPWTRLDTILTTVAWYTFVLGVVWRGAHLFYFHKATDFIYSDMMGYVVRANGLHERPGRESIIDTINPPGAHIYLSLFYISRPKADLEVASWLGIDPRWLLAVVAQFVLSALVPLLLAAAGYEFYGRRTALIALAMSSCYFPFIHYAANFLSEGPYLFFMVLSVWLLARSIRVKDWRISLAVGVVAGVSLGITAAMKPVVLLPGLLLFIALTGAGWRRCWRRVPPTLQSFTVNTLVLAIVYFPLVHFWPNLVEFVYAHLARSNVLAAVLSLGLPLCFLALCAWLVVRVMGARGLELIPGVAFIVIILAAVVLRNEYLLLVPAILSLVVAGAITYRYCWQRIPLVLATSAVGLMLIVIPLIVRATRLNENRFCIISTNGAVTALMGHYGEKRLFQFRDPKRPYHFDGGYPVAYLKGYHDDVIVPHGAYESEKLLAMAWKWCCEHPLEALSMSGLHVHELFYGTIPWPACIQHPWEIWFDWYQWIFWLLILLPAIIHLAWNWRALARLEGPGLADLILILPLYGLMITAFFTLGEPRYRVPYDALLILLAARFYSWGACRSDGLVAQRSATNKFVPAVEYHPLPTQPVVVSIP